MDRIYCPWCDDIRSFVKSTEKIKDKYKNEEIEFTFDVCRCEKCKKEVPGYPGYYQQRAAAVSEAYMELKKPDMESLPYERELSSDELAEMLNIDPTSARLYSRDYISSEVDPKILNDKLQISTIYGSYGGK